MQNKKLISFIMLLFSIILITTVNATDTVDNNMTMEDSGVCSSSENTHITSLPTTDYVNEDNTKEKEVVVNKKQAKRQAIDVNNYEELYNKIEEIKTNSENTEEIINLNPGDYNITRTINWKDSKTTKILTINGNNITLNGAKQYQFITVAKGYVLNLNNIVVTNCKSQYGSVIYNNGTVYVNNSNFKDNNATYYGGVNYNDHGNLVLNNSNFTDNTASNAAVNYNNGGNITIENSNFKDNTASTGGVNSNSYGNMSVNNSNFTENTATIAGVNYNNYGNLTIDNSIFTHNNATQGGVNYNNHANSGGVNYNDYGNITVENSNHTDNNASTGGVNSNANGNLTVDNSEFTHNTALYSGVNYNEGANAKLYLINSYFTLNDADAGGVNSNSGGSIIINNSTFTSNHARFCCINYNLFGNLTVENSNFTDNTASTGGIIKNQGTATIRNSVFTNSYDLDMTTIIATCINSFTLSNTTISNNITTKDMQTKLVSPIVISDLNSSEVINFTDNNVTINSTTRNSNGVVCVNHTFTKRGCNTININYPTLTGNNISLIVDIVKLEAPNINITSINTPKVNGNLDITVTVNDNDGNLLNDGYVIFKFNGCTLKDENNKTITSNVNGGLATLNYKLTQAYKAGEHNITVIYISDNYERSQNMTKLVIEKIELDNNIRIDPIVIKTGENTTINITLRDVDGNTITGNSSIVIKINGKTQQKTTITDGVATIEVNTENFKAKSYVVDVIVAENKIYKQLRIPTTILSVINRNAIINMDNITVHTMGKLPICATIKDTDGTLLNGSVSVKINGVLQKDADGNDVIFNVTNGIVNGTYQLPVMSAKNYNLTLEYVNKGYDKCSVNTTLTLIKSDIKDVEIKPVITLKGCNSTIKTTLVDMDGNKITGPQKVVVKINNKTVQNCNIIDGQLDLEIPTDTMQAKNYTMNIILGENNYYNMKSITVPLTIKSSN